MTGGHQVVAYDPVKEAVDTIVKKGATGALSYPDLACKLNSPRIIWLMVPSGDPTETVISKLATELSPYDVIIDGGNSNYRDSMRRADVLAEKGLFFLDVGTSGGIWGLKITQ
ncbi:NAD(P)-binding domain-containing protein [Chloroflexota bacterium]